MSWLVLFVVGWWGATWWPGIEHDAPPKGPLPDPWWWRLLCGVAAGGVAVVLGSANPMPGLSDAMSNPMPGLVLALAVGGVVKSILDAGRSALSRAG